MAGPTTQQLSDRADKEAAAVRVLEGTVKALEERVQNIRDSLNKFDERHNKTVDSLSKTTTQQGVLEAKVTALEERERKQWMLWVAVLAAILALFGNIAVALIRR